METTKVEISLWLFQFFSKAAQQQHKELSTHERQIWKSFFFHDFFFGTVVESLWMYGGRLEAFLDKEKESRKRRKFIFDSHSFINSLSLHHIQTAWVSLRKSSNYSSVKLVKSRQEQEKKENFFFASSKLLLPSWLSTERLTMWHEELSRARQHCVVVRWVNAEVENRESTRESCAKRGEHRATFYEEFDKIVGEEHKNLWVAEKCRAVFLSFARSHRRRVERRSVGKWKLWQHTRRGERRDVSNGKFSLRIYLQCSIYSHEVQTLEYFSAVTGKSEGKKSLTIVACAWSEEYFCIHFDSHSVREKQKRRFGGRLKIQISRSAATTRKLSNSWNFFFPLPPRQIVK